MRLLTVLLLFFCAALYANHPANVLERLGDYSPTLTFSESVLQRVVGPPENGEVADQYSASFRVVVGAEGFAAFDSATVVRLRIGSFLLDTTLGAASDYTPGGNHATFALLEAAGQVGSVVAKWHGETLTLSGSILAPRIPGTANTFHLSQIQEDENRYLNEATDASLTFGPLSGIRRLEVRGRSSSKAIRIGPVFVDTLWKVSLAGGLDFTPPKLKLLAPQSRTNASPQRYTLSTSPDAEFVTVEIDDVAASDPVVRADDTTQPPKARRWDGLLYLGFRANIVRFTAVDRSGNSAVATYLLDHDWRSGTYSGVLDNGIDDMTKVFVLKVRHGGAFTGTVQLGLASYHFKGTLTEAGSATLQIPRRGGGAPIDISLTLTQDEADFVAEPDPKPTQLLAVFDNTSVSNITRSVFDSETIRPSHIAGYYTAALVPDFTAPALPGGTGVFSMKANASGTIRALGKVADGTPFSRSGPLGGDGRFLITARLYGSGDGFLQGFVLFRTDNGDSPRCEGTLRWVQPIGATKATGIYPTGFNIECSVIGGKYAPGRRIKMDDTFDDFTPLGSVTAAELTLAGGEFDTTDLTREFDLDYKAHVHNLNAAPEDKLKLTLHNNTGFFSGSAHVAGHTAPAKKFFGVFVGDDGNQQSNAVGFYTSRTDTGGVYIIPR